jgi:hypothetical protein
LQFSTIKGVIFALESNRRKKAGDDFCHFLDELIVEMKSGAGFRASLREVSKRQSAFLHYHLCLLQHCIVSGRFESSSAPKGLQDGFYELFSCDKQTHNSVNRLTSLRHKVRIMSDFRRKSGQATLQIRSQSIVMFGLYLATVAFMSQQLGIVQIANEIAISGAMFLAGTVWMIKLGRGHKWKI